MIRLENVHKKLGGRTILDGLDLEVKQGETLVILGRSGTGKSVTLRHIVGLMTADQGRVEVLGHEISARHQAALLEIRSRIGYLFQDGALLNWLSIADNVGLPLRERHSMKEKEIQELGKMEETLVLRKAAIVNDLSGKNYNV